MEGGHPVHDKIVFRKEMRGGKLQYHHVEAKEAEVQRNSMGSLLYVLLHPHQKKNSVCSTIPLSTK